MLFLLLSQQATLSHAVSHWAPAALAASSGEQFASDGSEFSPHACELCIAAAQYAAALPAATFQLPPAEPAATLYASVPAPDFEADPALAFRSRAPPFA